MSAVIYPNSIWLLGIFQAVFLLIFGRYLTYLLSRKQNEFLEDLKWQSKVKEQATGVAEYLALAPYLKDTSSSEEYERATRLSFEMAMWLPEDIYREMVASIVKPSKNLNALTTIISVRQLMLKNKSGNLTSNDIAHHAPGIGNA